MKKRKESTTTTSVLDDLQMLNSAAAAKILNVSRQTLVRLYYSQELPGIVVGERGLRFPVRGIRKYIEDKLQMKPIEDKLQKKPTISKPRRAKKGHSRAPETTI